MSVQPLSYRIFPYAVPKSKAFSWRRENPKLKLRVIYMVELFLVSNNGFTFDE